MYLPRPTFRDLVYGILGVAAISTIAFGFHTLNRKSTIPGPSAPYKIVLEVRSVDKPVTIADPNAVSKTMSIETKHGSLSNKTFIEGDTAYIGMFSAITMYDVSAL
ncbi:hypothetical protein LCGC14_3125550 [marine sediment metagenome]|uniref:Uncharacterized protein n=1 Tax=marine sediment metagenome TaxID=412755 RepID=A0A0F8WQ02_9ZZZZ